MPVSIEQVKVGGGVGRAEGEVRLRAVSRAARAGVDRHGRRLGVNGEGARRGRGIDAGGVAGAGVEGVATVGESGERLRRGARSERRRVEAAGEGGRRLGRGEGEPGSRARDDAVRAAVDGGVRGRGSVTANAIAAGHAARSAARSEIASRGLRRLIRAHLNNASHLRGLPGRPGDERPAWELPRTAPRGVGLGGHGGGCRNRAHRGSEGLPGGPRARRGRFCRAAGRDHGPDRPIRGGQDRHRQPHRRPDRPDKGDGQVGGQGSGHALRHRAQRAAPGACRGAPGLAALHLRALLFDERVRERRLTAAPAEAPMGARADS